MLTETLATGYSFTEGARWHDGRFWFVDMHNGVVYEVPPDAGRPKPVFEAPLFLSGLGWLEDGSLIVTSMLDRKLLKVRDGEATVHADLLTVAEYHLNDLLVRDDHCYSVNFGYDAFIGAPSAPASVVHVTPNGDIERATDAVAFPNGMAITDDGATFIVAETYADRILAYDRDAEGRLTEQRVWAQLPEGSMPDGIALDAEGLLWVPCVGNSTLCRVAEGGEIAEREAFADSLPVSLAFGGDDGRMLMICTATSWDPHACMERMEASVVTANLDVPGQGFSATSPVGV